jgi:hypothetical protein
MKRAVILLAALLGACTEHLPSPTAGAVTTLNVTLVSPDGGTPGAPATDRNAVLDINAFMDDGTLYPGDITVNVFISFGGVLQGAEAACGDNSNDPIATLTFHGGHLENQMVDLTDAYGLTTVWVEVVSTDSTSHVVGASDAIFYPNPTIPQVQTPPDPAAANATFCSPFEKKFITMDHATGSGELIVDSIFNGAVTVIDTGTTQYNAMYVYTFGAPANDVVKGAKVTAISGNVSKFVGFTELNFPIIDVDDTTPPDTTKLPAIVVLKQTDIANLQLLNSLGGRSVQLSGQVCPVNLPNPNNNVDIADTNTQWTKYNTFILATVSCDSETEFSVALPSQVVAVPNKPNFDVTQLSGKPVTVTGMLKNSSGQNPVLDATGSQIQCDDQTTCATGTCVSGICKKNAFNFWTVVIRDASDLISY